MQLFLSEKAILRGERQKELYILQAMSRFWRFVGKTTAHFAGDDAISAVDRGNGCALAVGNSNLAVCRENNCTFCGR